MTPWKGSAISPTTFGLDHFTISPDRSLAGNVFCCKSSVFFCRRIGRDHGGRVAGHDLDIDDLGEIRNRKYGFLFSSPFLLPAFTVLENVAMPLFKVAQVDTSEAKVITEEILEIVGVSRIASRGWRLDRLDGMLAALARALVHHPRVLIAERVGNNLREDEAELLLSTLRRAVSGLGWR